jgi:hypothetical protein
MECSTAAVQADSSCDTAVRAHQPCYEYAIQQLHAFHLERAAQAPAELHPAAVWKNESGGIEAACGPPDIPVVLLFRENNTDSLQIPKPCIGHREHIAHEQLIGNSVVPRNDLEGDRIEIIIRFHDNHVSVRKGRVTGSPNHPAVGYAHPSACAGMTFRAQRSNEPTYAATDDQDIGFDQLSLKLRHQLPGSRTILDHGMDVHNLFRAENFAAETGDTMLAKFNDGQGLALPQSWNAARDQDLRHVDHIGRAYLIADAASSAARKVDAFNHAKLDPTPRHRLFGRHQTPGRWRINSSCFWSRSLARNPCRSS